MNPKLRDVSIVCVSESDSGTCFGVVGGRCRGPCGTRHVVQPAGKLTIYADAGVSLGTLDAAGRLLTAKGYFVNLSDTRKHLNRMNIKSGPTSTLIANRAILRGISIYSDDSQRLTLQRGTQRVWFDGAQSNINKVLAQRCVRYKDVTARLLRSHGIDAPENTVFGADQVRPAWDWAAHELPVVVKPPNGGKGTLVHVGVTESAHFEQAFAAVAEAFGEVLVERFVEGVEHRVLLIYGKVAAAQRRVPAHVIGNGRSTVRALIRRKNRLRAKSKNAIYVDAQIPIDHVVVRQLSSLGMTLESVPGRGEQVWLRSNSNVSSGGEAHDATDDLSAGEIAMAEKVAKAIPGLRVAGLDMLLPRDGKGDAPHILEVNSSPLIAGHHYPWAGESRDAAAMLVDAMFPSDTTGEPSPEG